MNKGTVLCALAFFELLGLGTAVADGISAFDLRMLGAIMPGMFISSRGPSIDFVTSIGEHYHLQRHAVKQCMPCPGVGLDVCKLKLEYESGALQSALQWSHLFQVVTPQQHLALVKSNESFSCQTHWSHRFLPRVIFGKPTASENMCAIHPIAERTCVQCIKALGGRLQNPCSKCSYFGFDCSCVPKCSELGVPQKPMVKLQNGCFGLKNTPYAANRSTALYSYSFGNFRREMSSMTAVKSSIAHYYDMFYFTDSRSISSIMKLISQGWTVCPVEPSLIDGVYERGDIKELNHRMVAKWFKFGHIPAALQSYQYLIHADCSTFGANHNYYRIPQPNELSSLITRYPLVSLFWSSHPLRSSAVQEIIATVEENLEPPGSAARWLAQLRKDPFFYGILDDIPVFQTGLFVRKNRGQSALELTDAFKELFWTMHQHGLRRDQNVLPFILFKHLRASTPIKTMCAFNVGRDPSSDLNCRDAKWPQLSSVALAKGLETPRVCSNPEWGSQPSFVSYSGKGGLPVSEESTDEQSRIANLGCKFQNDENPASVYMWKFAKSLKIMKRRECSNLVVYGAAFGSTYTDMMNIPKNSRNLAKTKALLREHGSCFFIFVQQEEDEARRTGNAVLTKLVRAKDGLNILLPVDLAALNVVNKRRGTKLFKFFGHKIFPWAKKILWQDAKLGIGRKFPLNINLNTYFEKTVQRNDVCVAFMGLPIEDVTMGSNSIQLKRADFNRHCTAIVNSGRKDVTDDRKGLLRQCLSYQEKVLLRKGGNISVDLSRNLIDTALIAWDFQKERCRDFADKLYCTWAHEVNCFSDRDQVSFPYALYQMGLQEQPAVGVVSNPDDVTIKHATLTNTQREPLVHIVDSKCHWYEHYSIDRCLDGVIAAGTKRVAVMVAGSYNRYFLKSSAVHLIKPLTKQGYNVDYFLSLTTESARAFRAEMGYTSFSTFDPEFGAEGHGRALRSTYVGLILRKTLGQAGANLREFSLQHQLIVDSDERLHHYHCMAKRENPTEDPDLRFPTKDLSASAAHAQNAVANRNLLRLHLAMERLWYALLKAEMEDGSMYDYVLFLRDDIKWLAHFDMNKLIAQGPADVYLLACDARKPPLHPDEINDHGLVAKRSAADVFGLYLSRLLQFDVDECRKQMTRPMGDRGCNSEMLLKWVMEKESLDVRRVGQKLLPFQRSMHLNLNGRIVECFHKYCKSSKDNLEDFGVQRCKNIQLPSVSV